MINNQGQKRTEDDDKNDRLIKEYLENGGTITQCEPNARTEEVSYTNSWGKRRKPQAKTTPEEE